MEKFILGGALVLFLLTGKVDGEEPGFAFPPAPRIEIDAAGLKRAKEWVAGGHEPFATYWRLAVAEAEGRCRCSLNRSTPTMRLRFMERRKFRRSRPACWHIVGGLRTMICPVRKQSPCWTRLGISQSASGYPAESGDTFFPMRG